MKVKFLFLVSIFSFCITHQAFSQYKGGVELGGNIMGASEFALLGQSIETNTSWGIRFGYVAVYDFNERFFFRGALLINQRGFNFSNERWGLNAVDLPLNLGLNVPINDKGMKWFIDGGANMEYNFRGFTKVDDELVVFSIGNESSDIMPFSFGFNAGTGIHFNKKVTLRLSYYQGLTNLLQSGDDSWKNYVIGAGLTFFFSKK